MRTPDLMARLYDWESAHLLDRQMQDIGFYRQLALSVEGPVLELCCGTGRVTLPLAEAGISVTAIDVDPGMLSLAKAKTAAMDGPARDRVRFVEADMRSFQIDRAFPLVLVPYNSFQLLLTTEDQEQCLSRIRDHLFPGGLLAMEIYPFQQDMTEAEVKREHQITDSFEDGEAVVSMYESATNDFEWQITCWRQEYRLVRPNQPPEIIRNQLSLRTIYRHEMERLLDLTGFRVESLYGSYQFGPYPGAETPTMLFVASRRK